MNERQMSWPGPIGRREFMQVCAGSLGLAALS